MTYQDSKGSTAQFTLPSNRVPLVLDSASRDAHSTSVYDFHASLNSALSCAEMFYSKLHWSQPLFSHNARSSELIFQVQYSNGDASGLYVVYALPFVMYGLFDGNPVGSYFQAPQLGSYASMMEIGLNSDVRTIGANMTPILEGALEGKMYDPILSTPIDFIFRYSPSKGFAMSCSTDDNNTVHHLKIKLWDCDYIRNAHFTHGFGVLERFGGGENEKPVFLPRSQWVECYMSDGTPTLLPYRYVVIKSTDLTRDRRMTSFASGSNQNFNNEVNIISLNYVNTGFYKTYTTGDDSTVFAFRSNYTPSNVDIAMGTDTKDAIICGDPLSAFLSNEAVSSYFSSSYIDPTSPYAGRGNPAFVNFLVFGSSLNVNVVEQNWTTDGTKPAQSIHPVTLSNTAALNGLLLSSTAPYTFLFDDILPDRTGSVKDTLSFQRTTFQVPSFRSSSYSSLAYSPGPGTNVTPTLKVMQMKVHIHDPPQNWKNKSNKLSFVFLRPLPDGHFRVIFYGLSDSTFKTNTDTTQNIIVHTQETNFRASTEYPPQEGERLVLGAVVWRTSGVTPYPTTLTLAPEPLSRSVDFRSFLTKYYDLGVNDAHVPIDHYFINNLAYSGYNPDADGLCEDVIHEFLAILPTS